MNNRGRIIGAVVLVAILVFCDWYFDKPIKPVVAANTKPVVKVEKELSRFLPNPYFTPGKRFPRVTKEQLCTVGYTKTVRDVTESKKKVIFDIYKVDRTKDQYEVDHLISLQLGGNNDISNLWPQSYTTQPWNARIKDKLENRLNKEMCNGNMSVREVQERISKDWILTYCELYDDMVQECKKYKGEK
jgi:hypothetical protein